MSDFESEPAWSYVENAERYVNYTYEHQEHMRLARVCLWWSGVVSAAGYGYTAIGNSELGPLALTGGTMFAAVVVVGTVCEKLNHNTRMRGLNL